MTHNPLTALRQYVDFSDKALVASLKDECADAGLYFDELGDDPGVWIYRWKENNNLTGKPFQQLFYINDSELYGPCMNLGPVGYTGAVDDLEEHLLQYVIDEGCNPPGFVPETPNGCPHSITCKHDIDVFVDYLFATASIAYHWDEMASSYVNAKQGSYVNAKQERVFSAQVSKHIDNLTEAALTLDAAYFQGICMDMQRHLLKNA